MQLNQEERNQCEELLTRLNEAANEAKENYRRLISHKTLLEELLRDGGDEIKQKVEGTLVNTNNE